ncbi:Aste57867_15533 [Aphanomyces stellatus]|uniref:Aste57867_15533 protein n=1 Tax=Aphanomyces stellatus TaxID=120398 RepID=A0A485L3C5_9STRA|nr:hypothetical protein As57867_015477 [Aphanomyces stellatus]VFT92335.1 Aste57867_15533 [Aphanomyces stellatus]
MDAANVARKPKVRTCYVCGREYGLSSFEIHLKQCKQLWIAQEELKPLKERRPVPEPPPILAASAGDDAPLKTAYEMTAEELEAQNRAAQQAFEQKVCQRPSTSLHGICRLAIHNRSCTAEHPAKAVGQARLGKDDTDGDAPPPSKPKAVKPSTPPTDKGSQLSSSSSLGEKPLSGHLSSNRKQRDKLQSPLTSSENADTPSSAPSTPKISTRSMSEIKAKLDHWEKIALQMVQDIRDLKLAIDQA